MLDVPLNVLYEEYLEGFVQLGGWLIHRPVSCCSGHAGAVCGQHLLGAVRRFQSGQRQHP